jgi:hypothetical protein
VAVVGTASDKDLWVTEVLKPGLHWNSRVLPKEAGALEAIAAQFTRLGCTAYASGYGLVVVDVSPAAVTADVLRLLQDGEASRVWEFDHGIAPDQVEAGGEDAAFGG